MDFTQSFGFSGNNRKRHKILFISSYQLSQAVSYLAENLVDKKYLAEYLVDKNDKLNIEQC